MLSSRRSWQKSFSENPHTQDNEYEVPKRDKPHNTSSFRGLDTWTANLCLRRCSSQSYPLEPSSCLYGSENSYTEGPCGSGPEKRSEVSLATNLNNSYSEISDLTAFKGVTSSCHTGPGAEGSYENAAFSPTESPSESSKPFSHSQSPATHIYTDVTEILPSVFITKQKKSRMNLDLAPNISSTVGFPEVYSNIPNHHELSTFDSLSSDPLRLVNNRNHIPPCQSCNTQNTGCVPVSDNPLILNTKTLNAIPMLSLMNRNAVENCDPSHSGSTLSISQGLPARFEHTLPNTIEATNIRAVSGHKSYIRSD